MEKDNSSDPTLENRTATIVNRILSALIENAGEDAVIALIVGSAPAFFAIPVVGWIAKSFVKFFVSKFGTFFYQVAAKKISGVIIDSQAFKENSDLKDKASKLQDAIATGDKDEIAKADQELEDAWGDLIHLDGAARP